LELIPADDHGHEALRSTLLRETQHRGFVGRILLQNNNLAALGGRRDVPSAAYVDGMLKGAKPSGHPVQAPTKFQLVVNLKTTKALGLTLPPTLLAIADEFMD